MIKLAGPIHVEFLIGREGGTFTAYAPALDLATCAGTMDVLRRRVRTVVRIFIEELTEMGTLQDVLHGLGWKLEQEAGRGVWIPPADPPAGRLAPKPGAPAAAADLRSLVVQFTV